MSDIARPSIFVEQATIGDCRESAALLMQQLIEHRAEPVEESLVTVLKQVISDPARGFVLLAREDRMIIGVTYLATILSAEHCGKVGWLEELYVLPEYRSKGVGSALLTEVIERARGLGIVAIDLEVDAAHRRAEELYRHFGFRPLDRSRWVRVLQ